MTLDRKSNDAVLTPGATECNVNVLGGPGRYRADILELEPQSVCGVGNQRRYPDSCR